MNKEQRKEAARQEWVATLTHIFENALPNAVAIGDGSYALPGTDSTIVWRQAKGDDVTLLVAVLGITARSGWATGATTAAALAEFFAH